MLCELFDTGLIKIRGNDAKKFLQGQLTCDVQAEPLSMGAHCNPKGRIISLFYLFHFQEAYYLLMQLSMIPIAMNALKKYAVFFKTEITDVSKEILTIGCQDIDINQIDMQNLVYIPLPGVKSRFMIAGEMNALKTQLNRQINTITLEHWKILNIRDGIPTLYPETSEKFLPHEINLDQLDAINFEKGCYTGQEIIARMHYRGKLKNRLYQAEVFSESLPQPGADIYSMQEPEIRTCGMIVDACHAMYNNKYHVLIVANELNNNSKPLFLTHNSSSVLTVQF